MALERTVTELSARHLKGGGPIHSLGHVMRQHMVAGQVQEDQSTLIAANFSQVQEVLGG